MTYGLLVPFTTFKQSKNDRLSRNFGNHAWGFSAEIFLTLYGTTTAKLYIKISFSNSEKTHFVSITKSNRSIVSRKIIDVFCVNNMKSANALCGKMHIF